MLRFIAKYICFIFLLIGTSVVADENDPFDVTLYGSFLHTETVPNALFFFNDIEQYDGFELRRALRNHNIDTVVLASDGGNVFEGLNMAGIIHDKGIITYVPELPDEMGCYSACSFMFFGGKIRQADGVLAVHQTGAYGNDRDKAKEKVSDTQQVTQFTVSEIIGFLNEFETPAWVYEKMFRSREFYEFNEEEKARLASRADEIEPQNLYAINGFINAFFEHLDKLERQVNKSDELKNPEVSKEEERRIVVVEIQKLLNAAGCNAGVADGIWGKRTQAAALLFAKMMNIEIDPQDILNEVFLQKLRDTNSKICPRVEKKKQTKPSNRVAKREVWSGWDYLTVMEGKRPSSVSVVKKSENLYELTFPKGLGFATSKRLEFPVNQDCATGKSCSLMLGSVRVKLNFDYSRGTLSGKTIETNLAMRTLMTTAMVSGHSKFYFKR